MAYNGVALLPEYWKYQKYLWQENLDENSPVITMFVKTLIYGIRPSGNLTLAGFDLLGDYVLEHFPEYKLGAEKLKTDK